MTGPAGSAMRALPAPRLLTTRRHIDLCLINGGTCPGR